MKKNPMKPKTYACRILLHGDSLKRVELVEQVLVTGDDTRLFLHVMHGNVSLH